MPRRQAFRALLGHGKLRVLLGAECAFRVEGLFELRLETADAGVVLIGSCLNITMVQVSAPLPR